MKVSCMILSAILAIIFLAGCSHNPPEPTRTPSTYVAAEEHNRQTEADNPTTVSTEPTESAGTTEPTDASAPAEETAPAGPEAITGSLEIRLADWDTDDNGTYLTYAGGEMEVPILLTATGTVQEKEIGILLFVDGQPQPYRTAQSQEYAYMHTFRLSKPIANEATVWFIPITGATGDAPEVYAQPLLDPHRTLATNFWPSLGLTSGIMFRLKYRAAPPAAAFPTKQIRLTQITSSYTDTTCQEIGTWSEEDLRNKYEISLYVNGKKGNVDSVIYEVSEISDITLRFEVWGSPDVHYGVVFFVDNQPVFSDDGLPVYAEVRTGQKTVVEATLSMADFDGESLVYAVLVPRNYAAAKNHCFLICTKVFFLTEQIDPDSSTL